MKPAPTASPEHPAAAGADTPGRNTQGAANVPAGLAETAFSAARFAEKSGPSPVHLWDPPFCGAIDIRIAPDGSWHYLGTPITRAPLVRLFSGLLKREGDDYFLVTPVEKLAIAVDDVPFVAVDVEGDGRGPAGALTFVTLTGDSVTAGPDHPLRLSATDDGAVPYVMVRDDLWARIDRKTFYRLVDLGEVALHDGESWFGVWSGGMFFPLRSAADLG